MNRYHFDDKTCVLKLPEHTAQHVHYLDGRPLMGTSTVGSVLSKPLSWWASGEACKVMGWTNSKVKVEGKYKQVPYEKRFPIAKKALLGLQGITTKDYLAILDRAYRAHSEVLDRSADKGTALHEVLENYVKTCIETNEGKPIGTVEGIEKFTDFADQHIKKFLWSEIHCYNEDLWTGGVADVGWLDHQDRVIAGDFKSAKEAYFTHFTQIAGYDLGLAHSGGLTASGEKIFELPQPVAGYCVIPFGQKIFSPEFVYNVADYRNDFIHTVALYKSKQQHEARAL